MIPTASTLDLKHTANGAKGQLITVRVYFISTMYYFTHIVRFYPLSRLDLTQKLDPTHESGPDPTHESGPALQIWAKNNGPF